MSGPLYDGFYGWMQFAQTRRIPLDALAAGLVVMLRDGFVQSPYHPQDWNA